MGDFKLHKRQFVIGPKPFKVDDEWESIAIENSLYLSYCKELLVTLKKDLNNNNIVLIGNAIQTDSSRNKPIEEATLVNENIEQHYDSWSGRWLLVKNNEIHTDFSGLLGCFYTHQNDELWVSSSLSILSQIVPKVKQSDNEIKNSKMNWYPGPLSKNEYIHLLLPSQILSLSSQKVRPKKLFPIELFDYSMDEAFKKIQDSLIEGMKQINNKSGTIWIPLSAGYESRLLLAAALKAKIPVKTYTMRKENSFKNKTSSTSLVSKADMTLPSQIAKIAGVEHRWIDPSAFSQEKAERYDSHTYSNTYENDRIYYAQGQWDWIEKDDVILLGQAFEIGTGHYNNELNRSPENIFREIVKYFNIKENTVQFEGLSAYNEWVKIYNEYFKEDVNWREKFYLEQRLASWQSANQQGLDLIDGERIHLFNNQQLMCAVLTLPESKRFNKNFIEELIEIMAPHLNQVPYNPEDPFFYSFKKNLVNLTRKSPSEIVNAFKRKIGLPKS